MRLATWNCRVGGFRWKAARIAHMRPDVLVVPECEDLDAQLLLDGEVQPTSRIRACVPRFKRGVGVLSYSGARITRLDLGGERLLFFDLYEVQVAEKVFLLGSVWTTRRSYRQVHRALELHGELLRTRDLVLLGDFNNNARYGSLWTDLIEALEPFGLVSAYHVFFHEDFGKESRPTYFHRAKRDEPFHVDYCFIPRSWVPRIRDVAVGVHEDWADVSDHMPLVVDVV